MNRRRFEENFFKALMIASMAIVGGTLLAIVTMVIWKGLPALSLSMITQTPSGGYYLGGGGGILNAIVGSLYLAIGATILALIISLPVALFLQREYIGKTRFAGGVRLSMDLMWGVPSIVYGAFGFIIMVYLGIRASLMAGIITLTFLEIPIMVRAMDEVIRTISPDLKDASYALGATRLETAVKVVSRQAIPGMMTAVLLAFGRGIGDAASVLFTAGYTDRIPTSLSDPVASMPLSIFFQLGTPFPEVRERAYATAVILLVIILVISLAVRYLSGRLSRHVIK